MHARVFLLFLMLFMGCGGGDVPVGANQSDFTQEQVKLYFANTFYAGIEPFTSAVSAKPAVVRLGEIPFTIRKTDIKFSFGAIGAITDVYMFYESLDGLERNVRVLTDFASGEDMVIDSPKPGLYGFWIRSQTGVFAIPIVYPSEIEQFAVFNDHNMLASTTWSLWKFYKRVAFADLQTLPVLYGMDAGIGSISDIRLLPRVHTVYVNGNNKLEDFSALFEPRIQPIVKLYLAWNSNITMHDIPIQAHINTLDIRGVHIPDDYVWRETSFPSLGQLKVSSGQLPEAARKKFEQRQINPVNVFE